VFSSEVKALHWAPMRSKVLLMSSYDSSSVPLNIMCSRKWLTPDSGAVSSRPPVRQK